MASQQPPARPWFRLASMIRPPAVPAPAPTPAPQPPVQPAAPQPRPSFPRPTFVQTFRPPVPPPQPQESAAPPPPPPPATTTSVPSSPTIKVSAPSSLPTSPAAVPFARTYSVPSSPKPKTSPPSSVPTSPPAPMAFPAAAFVSVPPAPAALPGVVSVAPTSVDSRAVSASPPPPPPSPRTAILTTVIPARPAASPPPPSPVTAGLTAAAVPARPAPAPAPAPMPATAPAPAPAPTATYSPKIFKPLAKSPPPSPKIKPVSAPPSPLVLPPAQIKSESERDSKGIPAEAQQKTILVQETSEKPKIVPKTSHGDFKRQTSEADRWGSGEARKWEVKKGVHETKERETYKKSWESEEHGVSIVTIAGENKGAIMELSPSGQRNGFGGKPHVLQKRGGRVIGSDGEKSKSSSSSSSSSSSDEDGRSKGKDKSLKSMGKTAAAPMKAFMNSNVQSVNSSIMFNSTCTHHDPGVHLSLSRKPKAGLAVQLKD